jgi:hypothetical protein
VRRGAPPRSYDLTRFRQFLPAGRRLDAQSTSICRLFATTVPIDQQCGTKCRRIFLSRHLMNTEMSCSKAHFCLWRCRFLQMRNRQCAHAMVAFRENTAAHKPGNIPISKCATEKMSGKLMRLGIHRSNSGLSLVPIFSESLHYQSVDRTYAIRTESHGMSEVARVGFGGWWLRKVARVLMLNMAPRDCVKTWDGGQICAAAICVRILRGKVCSITGR